MNRFHPALLTIALIAVAATAGAETVPLGPGESIQAAIAAADPGDTIELAAGTYDGDLDFLGKDVEVIGTGDDTVIRGTGSGPVVTFDSGEGPGAVIDSTRITGGSAAAGGGILIRDSSPTVVRNAIVYNTAASSGSGIYVQGVAAAPLIANNVIAYNSRNASGDPHGIQSDASSPMIVNNTLAAGDSNAMFLTGGAPVVRNNVLSRNGAGTFGSGRGRGICNFAPGAEIHYNVFYRNIRSALLYQGRDFARIREAQRFFGSPRLTRNRDRNPGFKRRRPRHPRAEFLLRDFELRDTSRILNRGDRAPEFHNHDGTRNTPGFTGGPLAPLD